LPTTQSFGAELSPVELSAQARLTSAYTDSMLNQFNALAARQFNLQSQASTGLRVQAPSDDPVAISKTGK